LPHKNSLGLLIIVVVLIVSGIVRVSLGWYNGVVTTRVMEKVRWNLRTLLVRRLSRLPFDYYRRAAKGDAFFRLERDADQVAELGGPLVLQAAGFAVSTISVVALLLWINPFLTIIIIPLNLLLWIVRRKVSPNLETLTETAQTASSQSAGLLQEYLNSVPGFQLLCCERSEAKAVCSAYAQRLRADVARRSLELKTSAASMFGVSVFIAILIGIGGYQVLRGTVSSGTLIACYSWMARLFDPFTVALDMYTRFARVKVSIFRLRNLLESELPLPEGARSVSMGSARGCLELRRVSFSYRNGAMILDNCDLHIDAGERVALIGESGVGKTTIGKILTRLENIGSGSVLLDGTEIREYTLRNLRTTICYLPQEPLVLDRSVRENLLLGNALANDEQLWHALNVVQLDDLVRAMPLGLAARAGARGTNLSGGERQRLVLARTLLRRPVVLILDECTSSLDKDTEAAVLGRVFENLPSQTILFISHRTSCFRWLSRVITLKNGQIVNAADYGVRDLL